MANVQWAYSLASTEASINEDKDTLMVAAPLSSFLEEDASAMVSKG